MRVPLISVANLAGWLLAVLLAMVAAIAALQPAQTRAAEAKLVPIWSYHLFPPFVEDAARGKGLSYEIARLLTEMSGGEYVFAVNRMSRARLDHLLDEGQAGITLWVHPKWLGDADRTRYAWSDRVFQNRSVVISRRDKPFGYAGPPSVRGLSMVAAKGHRFPGIDSYVEMGDVARTDVATMEATLLFLAAGRADFTILPEEAARYFAASHGISDKIHIAETPYAEQDRYVMFSPALTARHPDIEELFAGMLRSEEWRALVRRAKGS